MICYKGTKFAPNAAELANGFANYPPSAAPAGNVYTWFTNAVAAAGGVMELGFKWRGETPGGLIATSMTEEGAFDHMAYVYRIDFPGALYAHTLVNRTGAVTGTVAVGPAGVVLPTDRRFLFITDTQIPGNATVAAFYHGMVATKEMTFLTPVPRANISGQRVGGTQNRGIYAAMP